MTVESRSQTFKTLATGVCQKLSRLSTGVLGRPEGRLEIRRHSMALPGLGSEFSGATLVHLGDMHCSPLVSQRDLARHVETVNTFNADFVVITGDFITFGPSVFARRAGRILRGLTPRVAKLACLGNHDYGVWHPSGLGRSRGLADAVTKELSDAGVLVLRNCSKAFFRGESVLQFVGVEDFWTPQYNPAEAFELVDRDSPVISLAHNPDAAPQMAALGAHWTLAGHTHGERTADGRFWDVVYPTRHKRFVEGMYSLGRNRHLYVNRGLGNGMRRHNAEITVFTLSDAGMTARRTWRESITTQPSAMH